ncbi:hypothetical protein SCOR_11405 [Sulfidibacter corallicola]|uniref:Glycosyl hydrolase family 32 N-terminal domain-containing protein n=1 Tax=Sulfidibacter corallicola TaxID=2818388 RepID=A0A8A4TH48_SULCO|nr:hypothetical protein [Sulfidibacter corallicola]QTD48058.1 hypothetical protein J3U87_20940 [Sulfidibacter corallicola]
MRFIYQGLLTADDPRTRGLLQNAIFPTATMLENGSMRLFFGAPDRGRDFIFYLDVHPSRPTHATTQAVYCLEHGQAGTFDADSVLPASPLPCSESLRLYYSGRQKVVGRPYVEYVGLAHSHDDVHFRRASHTPICDRTDQSLFVRGQACVTERDGTFHMWYVGAGQWQQVEGREAPCGRIFHMTSKDGLSWPAQGHLCLGPRKDREMGLYRPWVIRTQGFWHMWASARHLDGAGSILAARSRDGTSWERDEHPVSFVRAPADLRADQLSCLQGPQQGLAFFRTTAPQPGIAIALMDPI